MKFVKLMCGVITAALLLSSVTIFAENNSEADKRYSFGTLYNAGLDTGFSKQNPISENDAHYGWEMGKFTIGGYTSVDDTDKGNPVFVKKADEKLKLFFELEQDISKLNGDDLLSVNEDGNGYDRLLNADRANFGYGALVIRRDNPLNSAEKPVTVYNFLSDTAKKGTKITVQEFDEGVYDLNLDYEIKNSRNFLAEFSNYKISLRFTVKNEEEQNITNNTLKYNLGELVNTGLDNGYTGRDKITINDPHYGWELGNFFVEGFTSYNDNDKEQPIFLKNAGDEVTLKFHLEQDIAKLNSNDFLSVNTDTNGFDENFGIVQANLERGALFIRVTNYQNITGKPEIYTDYLAANASKTADTTVKLCEEGDYEVALDYEIEDISNLFPAYHNYRISFKFSVRNGNCMIFPHEIGTGAELLNTSITKNGFYLDFAKSRYLDINVKKSVLIDGENELTEDTRFNKVAKDGDKFTDEGVYTITAKNRYTDVEPTVKVIYVGENDILRAHMTTNIPISDIKVMLNQGAEILEDGTISMPEPEISSIVSVEAVTERSDTTSAEIVTEITAERPEYTNSNTPASYTIFFIIGGVVLAAIITATIIVLTKHKKHTSQNNSDKENNSDTGEKK